MCSNTSSGTKKSRFGRPAEVLFGLGQFFFAERRAVGAGAVVLIRAAKTDMRLQDY